MKIFVENVNKTRMENLKSFIDETFSPLFKGMNNRNINKRNKQIFLLIREIKNLCCKDFNIFIDSETVTIDFKSSWFYKTNYFENSYEKVESKIVFYFTTNRNKMCMHTSAYKFREKILDGIEIYMQNKKSNYGFMVSKVTQRYLKGDIKAISWLKERGLF